MITPLEINEEEMINSESDLKIETHENHSEKLGHSREQITVIYLGR